MFEFLIFSGRDSHSDTIESGGYTKISIEKFIECGLTLEKLARSESAENVPSTSTHSPKYSEEYLQSVYVHPIVDSVPPPIDEVVCRPDYYVGVPQSSPAGMTPKSYAATQSIKIGTLPKKELDDNHPANIHHISSTDNTNKMKDVIIISSEEDETKKQPLTTQPQKSNQSSPLVHTPASSTQTVPLHTPPHPPSHSPLPLSSPPLSQSPSPSPRLTPLPASPPLRPSLSPSPPLSPMLQTDQRHDSVLPTYKNAQIPKHSRLQNNVLRLSTKSLNSSFQKLLDKEDPRRTNLPRQKSNSNSPVVSKLRSENNYYQTTPTSSPARSFSRSRATEISRSPISEASGISVSKSQTSSPLTSTQSPLNVPSTSEAKTNSPSPSIRDRFDSMLDKTKSRHLVVDWYQEQQTRLITEAANSYGNVEYIHFLQEPSGGMRKVGHVSFSEESEAIDAFADLERRFDATYYAQPKTQTSNIVELLHVPDEVSEQIVQNIMSKFGEIRSVARRRDGFGCVQVAYSSISEAMRALVEVHDTILFPDYDVHIIAQFGRLSFFDSLSRRGGKSKTRLKRYS